MIRLIATAAGREPWSQGVLGRGSIGHHAATKPCAGGLHAYQGVAERWKGKSQRSYEAIENEERLEPEHTARNPPLVTHTSVKVVLLLANQCVSDHTCFTSQHLEKGPTSFLSSGGVRG